MNDEKFILCKLIEYLESEFNFDFIAREVPFFSMRRRADIVAVNRNELTTYGFEIKSDIDTLNRLQSQLEDYRETFNFVYVVTTQKHVETIKKQGIWYGIFVICNQGNFHCLRKARKRILLKHTHNRQLRKSDHLNETPNQHYINWLCARYEPLYQVFIKERGENVTSEEDIKILSLRSDVINLR